jgi:hypothetical protein
VNPDNFIFGSLDYMKFSEAVIPMSNGKLPS